MPDVYVTIREADPGVVAQLAEILELRAADPQQRELREAYLADIDFPAGARVVEVGCGPGPVARALASRPGIGEVVGVDPSPIFLEKGRELARELANLTFVEGDARALPFDDDSFDVLIFHTTLCHVPEPERALAEVAEGAATRGPARDLRRRLCDGHVRARRVRSAAGVRRGHRRVPGPRPLAGPAAPAARPRGRLRGGPAAQPRLCRGAVLGRLHARDRRPGRGHTRRHRSDRAPRPPRRSRPRLAAARRRATSSGTSPTRA